VDGHRIAVRVGEGERSTERSVEGFDQDRDSGQDHFVMQVLRIVRLQPDGDAPTEVIDRIEVDERFPDCERDGSVAKTTACSGLTGARTRPSRSM